jgi:hypothetical protein
LFVGLLKVCILQLVKPVHVEQGKIIFMKKLKKKQAALEKQYTLLSLGLIAVCFKISEHSHV